MKQKINLRINQAYHRDTARLNLARKPLVSIIMPVHNAGKFLVPAIESILQQTYTAMEFIIVDDGSTDGSWKTIQSYRIKYPDRIKAFRTKKQLNEAGNGAMNVGLMKAKGRFIARMDADDMSHPRRIEKQVAYLLAHPDTILVGSQATVIDKHGKTIGTKRVPTDHDDIYNQYAIVHPVIHPSVMINRSLLPNPNKLYSCRFGINDDYYTFFKLLNYGKFANLEEPLIKYRLHGGNTSLVRLKHCFWNITKIRYEAIINLGYIAPWYVFLMILAQTMLIALLPEGVLRELFFYARGLKKLSIRFPNFRFHLSWTTIKRYALALR